MRLHPGLALVEQRPGYRVQTSELWMPRSRAPGASFTVALFRVRGDGTVQLGFRHVFRRGRCNFGTELSADPLPGQFSDGEHRGTADTEPASIIPGLSALLILAGAHRVPPTPTSPCSVTGGPELFLAGRRLGPGAGESRAQSLRRSHEGCCPAPSPARRRLDPRPCAPRQAAMAKRLGRQPGPQVSASTVKTSAQVMPVALSSWPERDASATADGTRAQFRRRTFSVDLRVRSTRCHGLRFRFLGCVHLPDDVRCWACSGRRRSGTASPRSVTCGPVPAR